MTKKYEVIIDFESKHLEIEANSKEEAKEKAIGQMTKDEPIIDWWVAEVDEVK